MECDTYLLPVGRPQSSISSFQPLEKLSTTFSIHLVTIGRQMPKSCISSLLPMYTTQIYKS